MAETYHGADARRKVEENLGRPLTPLERRIVDVEGYVPGTYRDTVRSKEHPIGVLTGGVGQTGEWIAKGFPAALEHHVQRARGRATTFDTLPEYLQNELVQSEYRGDLALKSGKTSKAVKLLDKGEYAAAADEFLRHAEYLKPETSRGIKDRLEATSNAMRRYGDELSQRQAKVDKQYVNEYFRAPQSLNPEDYT